MDWGFRLAGGVADGGVWLPATVCWYPAPGHQTLALRVGYDSGAAARGWTLERNAPRYDLAFYRLTFELPEVLDLGTSLGPAATPPGRTAAGTPPRGRRLLYVEGRASTGEGVLVLGAPDLRVTEGGAGPVITSPALTDKGLAASSEARLLLDFFSGVFPETGPPGLILVAKPDSLGSGIGFTSPGEGEGLILREAVLASSQGWRFAAAGWGDIPHYTLSLLRDVSGGAKDLTSLWFGQEESRLFTSLETYPFLAVKSAFRSFSRAMAVGELYGRGSYEAMLALEGQLSSRGEDWDAILGALDHLYREKGISAVEKLLAAVWTRLSAAELRADTALKLINDALTGEPGE